MKNIAQNHHFTVVIPTRERCDTLEHALHTCVIQNYDNLEIIISDNFSQDRTREVVESYKDPRIRYINTGKRLSMSDNYEFALSHVRPEGYIVYIGDDDGLLPNAIHDINAVVAETKAQVLRWELAGYTWPNVLSDRANRLDIPPLYSGAPIVQNPVITIQNILSFKSPARAGSLPMLYMFSAVEYEVINRIKGFSKRFYHSMFPDIYSGFAIAGAVNNFVISKTPYAIGGCSHHSIGASYESNSNLSEARDKFASEENLPFHASMVQCDNITEAIIEAFLQARDHLPFFQNFTLDMEKVLFYMMHEASRRSESKYMEVKDAVLKMGTIHGISEAALAAIKSNPCIFTGSRRVMTVRNLVGGGFRVLHRSLNEQIKGRFFIDCAPFGVKNVYDASLLCHHILTLREMKYLRCSAVRKSILSNVRMSFARNLRPNQK